MHRGLDVSRKAVRRGRKIPELSPGDLAVTHPTRALSPCPTFPLSRRRDLPALVPIRAAASAIGVSARTLRRRVEDGSLPAHRIRGRLYVRPEELRAFVERHAEVPFE